MQISDFLTLISLAIAVFAIIPNEKRDFILPLFTKKDIGILIALFVFTHYLTSFDWLLENWCSCLSVFTVKWGIPSTTWAYIVALIFIFYPVLKILPSSFTLFNAVKNTVKIYNNCLEKNKTDLLVEYIQTYHVKNIQKYLQSLSALPPLEQNILNAEREPEDEKELRNATKKMRFASSIYHSIIQNQTFICHAANKYPVLFAGIIKEIAGIRAANKKFVQCYIKCLFDDKNQQLIEELQKAGNIWNESIASKDSNTFPVLQALFTHPEMSKEHEIWSPVGESAIQSLKNDASQKAFLLKQYDCDLEGELWNQKIYIAMMYFKYMVNETIHNKGNVIWSPYFKAFTEELINLIPENNDDTELFAHYLIAEQNSIMKDWLDLAVTLNVEYRIIDTTKCLGQNIVLLCNANREKISENFIKEQIKLIVCHYFYLSNRNNENIAVQREMEWIEKILVNPELPDSPSSINNNDYKGYLLNVWEQFDKIPYQGDGSIESFERNVLSKIM
jgi:hypothetical protein